MFADPLQPTANRDRLGVASASNVSEPGEMSTWRPETVTVTLADSAAVQLGVSPRSSSEARYAPGRT